MHRLPSPVMRLLSTLVLMNSLYVWWLCLWCSVCSVTSPVHLYSPLTDQRSVHATSPRVHAQWTSTGGPVVRVLGSGIDMASHSGSTTAPITYDMDVLYQLNNNTQCSPELRNNLRVLHIYRRWGTRRSVRGGRKVNNTNMTHLLSSINPVSTFDINGFQGTPNNLKGHISPGDGHCLLWSLITSMKYQQHGSRSISMDELKAYVFCETINNADKYLPFVKDMSPRNLFSGLRAYLLSKCYNQDFGDIVIKVLANAFNVKLRILNEGQRFPIDIRPDRVCVSKCIYLHRRGQHYNGTVQVAPVSRTHSHNYHAPQVQDQRAPRECRSSCQPIPVVTTRPRLPAHKPASNRPSSLETLIDNQLSLPVFTNTNITGALADKLSEISVICSENNVDCCCVTETWCTPLVPDSTVSMNGYTLFRRDRRDGRLCGGIACYIRSSIPVVKVWRDLENNNLETMWLTLRPQKMPRLWSHISIGVVYHPPKQPDWTMCQHLVESMDTIKQTYPSTGFFVLGDFNHMKDRYLKSAHHLQQMVKQPTHMRSVIDLCYSNMAAYYDPPKHLPGIGLSKHQFIVMKPAGVNTQKPDVQFVTRRENKPAAKQALREAISKLHWEPVIKLPSCAEQVDSFYSIMTHLIDTYLPSKTVKRCNHDHAWVTDDFRRLVQLRQVHFHQGNSRTFNFYRNKVNRLRKSLKRTYYANKMKQLQANNPKQWWKLIKDVSGQSTPTNSLQGLANSAAEGSRMLLAEKINSSLQAVTHDIPPLQKVTYTPSNVPSEFIISREQVEKQMSKIKVGKAGGPDSVPNWLLRDMSTHLAPVICSIWNASFREAHVPEAWKRADIAPIPKTTPPANIEKDIRPISLTPTLSKGIEAHARNWTGLSLTPSLDPFQFGSRSKFSTTTALTQLIHAWLLELDKPGTVIRTLLIDYRKAFDRVDHTILLGKLQNLGLPDFLVGWYASFLSDRKQRVKIGDTTSSWADVTAGVPQGTLTGPTAFLLHINDLQTVCSHMKYVDDTSIWESTNISGSTSKLQQAADQVITWSAANRMQLNTDKTKEMTIYFGRKPLTFQNVSIEGEPIESVTTCKLLGVLINDKLTWDEHINYITSKANKRLYFLRMLRRANVNNAHITQVYTSTVRSVLEYAAEVWHPGTTQKLTQQVEHIQKRFLKIIYPDLSYNKALVAAQLETLECRREDICKTWFSKLCEQTHPLHHLLPPKRNITRLRKASTFTIPTVKTERLKRSPIFYGLFKYQS